MSSPLSRNTPVLNHRFDPIAGATRAGIDSTVSARVGVFWQERAKYDGS